MSRLPPDFKEDVYYIDPESIDIYFPSSILILSFCILGIILYHNYFIKKNV